MKHDSTSWGVAVAGLVCGCVATALFGLLALGNLFASSMEPACDVPTRSDARSCSVTGEDYLSALPAALLFVGCALLCFVLSRAIRSSSRTPGAEDRALTRTVVVASVVGAIACVGLGFLVNVV